MTIQVRVGGAWQPLTGCQVYASGAWRTIRLIQVYSSGAWHQCGNFATPLSSLTISPSPFNKNYHSGTLSTSGTISATPTGGLAPYTYSWSVVSSSPTTVVINRPTVANTTVSADVSAGDVSCTLSCTVTDSLGSTAFATVNGTFTFTPTGGGGA